MSTSNSSAASDDSNRVGKILGSIIVFMFVMGCMVIIMGFVSISLCALIVGLTAHFFGAIAAGIVGAALAALGAWVVVSGTFGKIAKWVTQKMTGIFDDDL